jgi:hypothetical protein
VIVTVPTDTPVTTPDKESTVARPVLLLLHVPPAVELLNEDIFPAQILKVPVIAETEAFTVITFVTATEPQLLVTV